MSEDFDKYNEKLKAQLNLLVGKTIEEICYDGKYSAPINIKFTDGTEFRVDAEGDDASHIEFEITNQNDQD